MKIKNFKLFEKTKNIGRVERLFFSCHIHRKGKDVMQPWALFCVQTWTDIQNGQIKKVYFVGWKQIWSRIVKKKKKK